jgi:hypothetical protein
MTLARSAHDCDGRRVLGGDTQVDWVAGARILRGSQLLAGIPVPGDFRIDG